MSRTNRRALFTAFALGASLLAVSPVTTANAAGRPVVSKPGTKAKVYRADVKRRPGAAAVRAQRLTIVPGTAATPRSTWNVTYAGFPAQAQASFQAAVNIWAGIVTSSVPIVVSANFQDLGPGVLGYAGPHADIPVSSPPGDGVSWYPVALANALKGSDQLTPHGGESGVDIEASFSSTEPGIYYGTDSNPPAGYVDFESIVLHELGHGLGFGGSADFANGVGRYDSPRSVFDYFNVTTPAAGQRMISIANNSTTLGAAMTSNDVYWDGANAKAANGGSRVKLYAPGPWEGGSSIAHLDESTFPLGSANSLMTPYVSNQEVVHSPGPVMVGMMRDMGWNAVLTAPSAPTGVTAEPNNASVALSWTAANPNGSPVTGYTIFVNDGTTTTPFPSPGSGTTRTVTGLDNLKTYTFTVTATNAVGTSAPSAASSPVQPAVDVTAPTVTITSVHTSGVGQATGAYTFTGADPGHANPTLTFLCSLDGAPANACVSPVPYASYGDGTSHTFSVTPKDAANNIGPTVLSGTWKADAGIPSVTAPVLPTYTLAAAIGESASASDAAGAGASGIKSYDFRYRRAAFSGGWSALVYPSTWQGVTTRVNLAAVQGYTYCFGARSRDNAGNVSAWSPERCTSTALDDRGLYASSGWVREVYARHFLRTDTKTSTAGATLTRTNVQTLRLALVAVKCAKCGTVGVYFNGRLIKNVNLKQAATAYQTVFPIISFPSLQTGTVVIKPLTKGAVNYIDGLVMSKV